MEETRLDSAPLGATGLEIATVGFRRPDQVDELIEAGTLMLTEEEVAALERDA